MQQMRRIVELAKEEGIRDRVSIMVGGAPISQSFCDEIHADVYTADAASAARAAVKILTKNCGGNGPQAEMKNLKTHRRGRP